MSIFANQVELGSVCTFIGGGTPSRDNPEFFKGDIPWVTVKDFISDIILDTQEHITDAAVRSSATKIADERSILLVSRVGLGKVALAGRALAINQDIKAITPSACMLPEFCFWFLRNNAQTIIDMGAGSTVKGITLDQIKRLKVLLPPLDEQKRSVDILDRAASIQRLRQAADEKLKQIIPALFVDMFGDPASNPKGLPLIKLGDLIERIETGKNVTAGSGTSNYSILKVSAVTSGTYKEHESKPAPDDHMIVYNHIVREGDFLFSRANTVDLVGATAIVHQTNGKTLLPDKLWRIRWRKDANPRYMLAVMQNKEIRAELGRASSGTSASMRNISQGRLASIEVPVASFEQQSQFGRISESLTAKAWLSQQASQHAQSAAASLAQSVFGN
jgi:type I restriction enzyme S subunit